MMPAPVARIAAVATTVGGFSAGAPSVMTMPHFTTVFMTAAMTIAFTATLASPVLSALAVRAGAGGRAIRRLARFSPSLSFLRRCPLSIPAGLCVAVSWANRGKVVTWRRLGTLLTIVIAVTVVVWIVLEWMMPHGNQAFREMVAARLAVDGRALVLEPGLNELGLSRLGQRTDPAAPNAASGNGS